MTAKPPRAARLSPLCWVTRGYPDRNYSTMSWPTTPVRAKRGRSVNSVWAIQVKRAQLQQKSLRHLGGPHSRAMTSCDCAWLFLRRSGNILKPLAALFQDGIELSAAHLELAGIGVD